MRKIVYKAKFTKTGEEYNPSLIEFDENGQMKKLTVHTNGGIQEIGPEGYEIFLKFEDPTDEEVEKIVEENKARNDKFKI